MKALQHSRQIRAPRSAPVIQEYCLLLSGSRRRSLAPKVEADNNVKQVGATFTVVLQADPHIDAIRNLRIALKVLRRRFGLRVLTIREM